MSLLPLFFSPSAFSLIWFVTDSASTFPKQNLYLKIKRSKGGKGGRESKSLFLLRVSGLYKHLLSLFQCPSLCSAVVLPHPTVFWSVPRPWGVFLWGEVGGRLGIPAPHIAVLSSSELSPWLWEPQAIGLLLRIARRAMCSFSSREAAKPVAWAELSSIQFSFLLFVQEHLSHNPSMHLKSLLQDKCKMLSVCDVCSAGQCDLQKVSLQECPCTPGTAGTWQCLQHVQHPPPTKDTSRTTGKTSGVRLASCQAGSAWNTGPVTSSPTATTAPPGT